MRKLQRGYSYISYLPKEERFLFWLIFIGQIGLAFILPLLAWLMLRGKVPKIMLGLFMIPVPYFVFRGGAFSDRLIIRGMEVAREKHGLSDEEEKHLSSLEEIEKSYRTAMYKEPPRRLALVNRVLHIILYILFALILLFFIFTLMN